MNFYSEEAAKKNLEQARELLKILETKLAKGVPHGIRDYSQISAITTLGYRHSWAEWLSYLVAGLNEEAGEVAGQYKRMLRDDEHGPYGPTLVSLKRSRRDSIIKELGDMLWYADNMATIIGSSLEEVAIQNNMKLLRRLLDGKIKGQGSNR